MATISEFIVFNVNEIQDKIQEPVVRNSGIAYPVDKSQVSK